MEYSIYGMKVLEDSHAQEITKKTKGKVIKRVNIENLFIVFVFTDGTELRFHNEYVLDWCMGKESHRKD